MTSVRELDISQLEGWLRKKKSSGGISSLISDANLRWFKVYNLNSNTGEANELRLALCYFQNQKSQQSSGYIYLKDISEIFDDGNEFTLVSPSRTFTLISDTPVEHYFWLKALVKLCPDADTSKMTSKIGETFIDRGGRIKNSVESSEKSSVTGTKDLSPRTHKKEKKQSSNSREAKQRNVADDDSENSLSDSEDAEANIKMNKTGGVRGKLLPPPTTAAPSSLLAFTSPRSASTNKPINIDEGVMHKNRK